MIKTELTRRAALGTLGASAAVLAVAKPSFAAPAFIEDSNVPVIENIRLAYPQYRKLDAFLRRPQVGDDVVLGVRSNAPLPREAVKVCTLDGEWMGYVDSSHEALIAWALKSGTVEARISAIEAPEIDSKLGVEGWAEFRLDAQLIAPLSA